MAKEAGQSERQEKNTEREREGRQREEEQECGRQSERHEACKVSAACHMLPASRHLHQLLLLLLQLDPSLASTNDI